VDSGGGIPSVASYHRSDHTVLLSNLFLLDTLSILPDTSAKNISVWAEWLRQSGRAPSEQSEMPWWRISLRPESIQSIELQIALRSLFRCFLSLCWFRILHKNSGVVANCHHTSEEVHCVQACIGIAMHKDPRN